MSVFAFIFELFSFCGKRTFSLVLNRSVQLDRTYFFKTSGEKTDLWNCEGVIPVFFLKTVLKEVLELKPDSRAIASKV
jgi:hypothetical protein